MGPVTTQTSRDLKVALPFDQTAPRAMASLREKARQRIPLLLRQRSRGQSSPSGTTRRVRRVCCPEEIQDVTQRIPNAAADLRWQGTPCLENFPYGCWCPQGRPSISRLSRDHHLPTGFA